MTAMAITATGAADGSLRDDGYQVLRGILCPDALELLRGFLERSIDRSLARTAGETGIGDRHGLTARIAEVTAPDRFAAYSREAQQILSGHFDLETRLDPQLWVVPRQEALRALLRRLLGSDTLFAHLPPAARFVLPGNRQAGVPAHQDVSYNTHLSGFLTVWVPLVEIDEACGGVVVYPGTHRGPVTKVETGAAFWLEGVPTDGLALVRHRMSPGDVLILDPRVVHASLPNTSGRVRISIDYRFFGDPAGSTKHHLDMQRWTVIAP